ncbi:hypothetical protein FrEUN1fDRAFT_7643 [Parafrankia sp. EUN1f]|nr:hypothetical protein FrEUN1fDRAFT_7643 [Parafrankia sp. EUN1f]
MARISPDPTCKDCGAPIVQKTNYYPRQFTSWAHRKGHRPADGHPARPSTRKSRR